MQTTYDISAMLVKYLGWGTASWPQHDKGLIKSLLSPDEARVAEEKITAVMKTFRSMHVDWKQHNLDSATREAGRFMKQAYPELTEEAIKALEWCFSYDWK